VRSSFIGHAAFAAFAFAATLLSLLVAACSSTSAPDAADSGPFLSLGDSGFVDAPEPDARKQTVDGGFAAPEGGVIRSDRFVTQVVSVTYGDCAGFGLASMPDIVEGPPVGSGAASGSLDVVSLVFENAFYVGGDSTKPVAKDLGEVSVSDDGMTWKTFPCMDGPGPTYGSCAGWHPVYSAPGNGISPLDPQHAGGDPFDLADVGLTTARFVRIRDVGGTACPTDPASKPTNNGFDLDAIAIVNAQIP
jgi:hypothetical protein